MPINKEKYQALIAALQNQATLVAVSKTKPVADIQALYDLGQRHFGENYVQEMADKQPQLPADIHWHFIGHLQSNKVKQIASFVHLVHGVDSFKLLAEINKQAGNQNRIIPVLLQVHIAREETKFGLDEEELAAILQADRLMPLENIRIAGLMGMASLTTDTTIIQKEFKQLRSLFDAYAPLQISHCKFQYLSMGMSSDYPAALSAGSNMVRIGSLLFGER